MTINKVDIEVDYTKPVVNYYNEQAKERRTPDLERFDRVMDHIQAHQETWRQSDWASLPSHVPLHDKYNEPGSLVVAPTPACGTTLCVAGHTVVDAGYYILFEDYGRTTAVCVDNAGQRYLISDLAAKLLGLTWPEEDELFRGTSDFITFEAVRKDLAARRVKMESSSTD